MMIEQRRKVPEERGYKHAGQFASLAVDNDGYRAWGFGQTESEADNDAVRKVNELNNK